MNFSHKQRKYDIAQPISDDLKRAVKLFNRWQFQEAQDSFIQLSEEAVGNERTYLVALSNLAAGFFRIWHNGGEPNAMVNYLEKGFKGLSPLVGIPSGVNMDGFIDSLRFCIKEAHDWRRGDIELFHRDHIPRINIARGR